MIISAVELKRCLGIGCALEHQQQPSRLVAWLRSVLFLGLISFVLVQYLPVSGKAQNNVVYALILVPALLLGVRQARELADVFRSATPLWAFFAVVACSALMLGEVSFLKTTLYTALFCLGVASAERARPGSADVVFRIFFICSALVLVYASIVWLVSGVRTGQFVRMEQLGGSAENPIYAGLLVASAMAYHAFSVGGSSVHARPDARQMLRIAVCFLAAILAVVVFQSRSALLGIALAFGAFGLMVGRVRSIALLLSVAGLLVVLLSTGENGVLERGLSHRPEIWADALRIWQAECSFWLGCGRTDELFIGAYHGTHNGYVGTLFRHGVLGALALAVLLIWYIGRGIRSRSRWFLVSLVGWGGMLTAMDGLVGSPAAWWMFVWFPSVAALFEQAPAQAKRD